MHVICKDGTTIQCQDFEAIDSGVLFYQETTRRRSSEDEEDEEEDEESASGFVPITEVQIVLPDEMVQGAGAQPAGPVQGTPAGAPPGARQSGMAQQQQQRFQGPPGGRPPESGGR